jgi:hypothetical protein
MIRMVHAPEDPVGIWRNPQGASVMAVTTA